MKRHGLRIFLCLVFSLFIGRESLALECHLPTQTWGAAKTSIDVWVSTAAATSIALAGVSTGDADDAARRAVAIWNEDGGVALKLYYRGLTSSPPATGITFFGSSGACPVAGGCYAMTGYATSGSLITGSDVTYYKFSSPGAPISWQVSQEDIATDLVGTMIHELGHSAFTLEHPGETANCNDTGQVTVMRGTYGASSYKRVLKYWDKLYARTPYGRRSDYSQLNWKVWNPGTSTWGSLMTRLSQNIYFGFRSLSQNYTWVLLGWTRHDAVGPAKRKEVFKADGTWPYGSNFTSPTATLHPVAFAIAPGTGEALMVYLQGETATNDTKQVCYRKSTDSGQSGFGTEICAVVPITGAPLTTKRNGVTAAFDPRSSAFIIAYPFDNQELYFLTVPTATSSTPVGLTAYSNQSWDAPGMACSSSANGCRFAYEDRSSTGCLNWMEAEVGLADGLVYSSVTRSQCWKQYDTPSIAYDAFYSLYRLAFHQSNMFLYARSMTAAGTSWTGLPDLYGTTSGMVSPPALSTNYDCPTCSNHDLKGWFTTYW